MPRGFVSGASWESGELGGWPHRKQEDFMGLRHRQLEKEGWVRQFVADGPLAKHAVETLVAVFQGGPKGGRKP
jgi:hypothetical protein